MAKKDNDTEDIPHERAGARPDYSVQPARKRLPKGLQETLDDDEKLWETVYEGSSGDTTDSDIRYAAYASRVRTILRAGQRYIAYTSDIGESFRPVAHPYLIKGAYAVSWLYLAGDVSHEGYKAYIRNQRVLHPELHTAEKESSGNSIVEGVKNLLPAAVGGSAVTSTHVVPGIVPAIEDYRSVMAQRAIFQGLASMGLPAFTIHSIVKYSGKAMKDIKNARIRTYGPIGLGLAAVPFLPYVFDEPVEKAVEWVFHKGFEAVGGPEAVAGRPVTGLKELRHAESKAGAAKEKEL
ncbi:hypothetical protein BU16DRAFT_531630 [Lophium mytilinum]|uniref:Mitochondrial fission process protein 1 n=1 Tax=Lophium mytilinum TaxID=390894 RepID=A0A6A6QBC6_9PEZI|nr:hypothetical protein BU16DRAFT_531630 [Lophium mytilinum]